VPPSIQQAQATRRCPVVPVFVEAMAWFCADCARETEFERPPCTDGHERDCPEWCCVECGCAVLVGSVVETTVVREVRGAA
jgi:hypothetical protein